MNPILTKKSNTLTTRRVLTVHNRHRSTRSSFIYFGLKRKEYRDTIGHTISRRKINRMLYGSHRRHLRYMYFSTFVFHSETKKVLKKHVIFELSQIFQSL